MKSEMTGTVVVNTCEALKNIPHQLMQAVIISSHEISDADVSVLAEASCEVDEVLCSSGRNFNIRLDSANDGVPEGLIDFDISDDLRALINSAHKSGYGLISIQDNVKIAS